MKNIRLKNEVLFLFFCVIMSMIPANFVSAKIKTGVCGKNANWSYDTKRKKLVISGKGVVNKKYRITKEKDDTGAEIKRVIIKEGITSIDNSVLPQDIVSTEGGTIIKLPKSLKKIGVKSFWKLDAEEIFLPQNVKQISNAAFWGFDVQKIVVSHNNPYFTSNKGVLLTKSSSTLVAYPREKMSKQYNVPKSVIKINALAFAGNRYLEKIELPAKLKKMGGGAFWGCVKLKDCNIAELKKIKKIIDYNGVKTEVDGSYSADNIPESMEDQGKMILVGNESRRLDDYVLGTFEGSGLKSFYMPENLKYMSSETFRHCYEMNKIFIGKNFVGEINTGKTCATKSLSLYFINLESIQVAKRNKKYIVKDSVLYSKNKKVLYQLERSKKWKKIKTFVVPEKVSRIANGAFYGTIYRGNTYVNLKEVIITGDLMEIGYDAFRNQGAKKIAIEGAVKYIRAGAFEDSYVERFECRKGIYFIDKEVFKCCFFLKTVKIGNSRYKLHYLGKDVFKACSELEQVSYTLENETFITGIGNMFRLLRRHFAELIMVWLQKDVMY